MPQGRKDADGKQKPVSWSYSCGEHDTALARANCSLLLHRKGLQPLSFAFGEYGPKTTLREREHKDLRNALSAKALPVQEGVFGNWVME